MAGFPRPLYPGDYQGLKFYDSSSSSIAYTVPSSVSAQNVVIAEVQVSDIVAGNLYQAICTPIQIYAPTATYTWDTINQGHYNGSATFEIWHNTPSVPGTFSTIGDSVVEHFGLPDAGSSYLKKTAIDRYYLAPETGTYTFQCVLTFWVDTDASSDLEIQFFNTIFGVRGICDPTTNSDFVSTTVPES